MVIDNFSGTSYENNVYVAWTREEDGKIFFSSSNNHGETWISPKDVSQHLNDSKKHFGVNLQVGHKGDVYACWAVTDAPHQTETAIGFNKYSQALTSWETPIYARNNIEGMGSQGYPLLGGIRTNSYPAMAVDLNNQSQFYGRIYIVWVNMDDGTDPNIRI